MGDAARDAAVAGVLGAVMLGVSSLGAALSGASMGIGLAGVLLTWFASVASGRMSGRAAAVLGAAWLGANAGLHMAVLGLGVGVPGLGSPPPRLAAMVLGVASAAAISAVVAARGSRLGVAGYRLLAAAAAVGAASPLAPLLLYSTALAAGAYALLEARSWSLLAAAD